MRIVIVGGGIAGVSAAQAVRKELPGGEVHIFTEEPLPLYYRPRLVDYLAGEAALESLVVYPREWYEAQGISLHLGQRVVEIDAAGGSVVTAAGERVPYDGLLLATGARPFVPPVPGLEARPPVHVLRTAEEAESLLRAARQARSTLVMGGGLLGLEAARSLSRLGLQVTVIEAAPHLLPRQLDGRAAEILQSRLEAMGLSFALGRQVQQVEPAGAAGGVAVTLQGGLTITADLMLVASGVRSRVELAAAAGCAVERGVVVDDRLATTVSGIYAAGDVAQHRGIVYGIWPPAMQQGRAAGAAMVGKEAAYGGSVRSHQLKVAGIDLVSLGDLDLRGEGEEEVVEDRAAGIYRRLVRKDGRLRGAILLGDISGFRDLEKQIAQGG